MERFLDGNEREALERVLTKAERTPPGKPGHIGREGIWAIRLLALTGMRRDEVRVPSCATWRTCVTGIGRRHHLSVSA